MNKYNVGDLVKFKYNTRNRRSFVRTQCKYGIILYYAAKKDTQYMIEEKEVDFGNMYYQVYWWPFNGVLFHEEDALELVSKMPTELSLTGTLR